MIQANELRIGNWVTVRLIGIETEGTPQQINANNLVDIAEEKGAFLNKKCYDAIPLTPEILEKAGRRYNQQDNNWEFEIPVSAIKWYFRWNVEWYSEIGGIYIDSKVQYVHQLQNLYFCLTGQELEIKL